MEEENATLVFDTGDELFWVIEDREEGGGNMYRKARQISDKEPYLEFDEESWDDVREEMVEVPEEAVENPSNFFRDVIANRLRDRGINELRDAMYAGWLWSREEIDIVESKRLL